MSSAGKGAAPEVRSGAAARVLASHPIVLPARMGTAQEGPPLGQVTWDREQQGRSPSSGIDRHVQGVAQSFLNLWSGGSWGSSLQ